MKSVRYMGYIHKQYLFRNCGGQVVGNGAQKNNSTLVEYQTFYLSIRQLLMNVATSALLSRCLPFRYQIDALPKSVLI